MEVETLEGETLTRLLNSDPNDPWPPSDLEAKPEPAAPPAASDEAPRRPSFDPKPAPGLAWEGGNQSRTDGQAPTGDAASLTESVGSITLESCPRISWSERWKRSYAPMGVSCASSRGKSLK